MNHYWGNFRFPDRIDFWHCDAFAGVAAAGKAVCHYNGNQYLFLSAFSAGAGNGLLGRYGAAQGCIS